MSDSIERVLSANLSEPPVSPKSEHADQQKLKILDKRIPRLARPFSQQTCKEFYGKISSNGPEEKDLPNPTFLTQDGDIVPISSPEQEENKPIEQDNLSDLFELADEQGVELVSMEPGSSSNEPVCTIEDRPQNKDQEVANIFLCLYTNVFLIKNVRCVKRCP